MVRLFGSAVGLVLGAFLIYLAVWHYVSPTAAISMREAVSAASASFFGWLGHELVALWRNR